jgi:uncharacterized SAM-binding protein YcdF (DUF218 family)
LAGVKVLPIVIIAGLCGILLILVQLYFGSFPIKISLAGSELIIILAGGENRVAAGAALCLENKECRVVLTNDGVTSRWSKLHGRNLSNVEWSEQELLAAGIPAESIVKLPFTRSGTIYDAMHARDFVLGEGIKSFTIVTSDYHTRRALWIFEKVFEGESVEIGIYPVSAKNNDDGTVVGYLHSGICRLKERLKYLYYRVRFGLWPPGPGFHLQAGA